MKIHSLFFSFFLIFLATTPAAFGEMLAFFEDGSLASGGAIDIDTNLASAVPGLQSVPNLTVSLSNRTLTPARDSFNGTISATGSYWLAGAMVSVPTTPSANSAYFEINLASANGYVLELQNIIFDWQVANNTDANSINFSCAVLIDFHDGNGFIQVGNTLTNSAKKTGSTAGFGTLQRNNTFAPTTGNTDIFYATIRIAMASSATNAGYAQFLQNIKVNGSVRTSSKPRPGENDSIKLADDGAWTWFNDPRALFHNGALYVGYVRVSDGASCINACDIENATYSTVVTGSLKQKDDHNNPALLPLADGRLMVFYSRHSADKYSQYCTSLTTTPTTAADWSPLKNSQTFTSTGISYQNPYQLSAENGRIYNLFRDIGWDPCFITSDDLGQTWSASNYLIQAGDTSVRPYTKYSSNYKDRIDVLYTDDHPKPTKTSLYHFYIKGGKIYKSDGTTLKAYNNPSIERTLANLPVLHDNGEHGTVIYQYSEATTTNYDDYIPGGRAWCSDIVYDKIGNPVCVFSVQLKKTTQNSNTDWDQARIFYYYARFDSTTKQWKKSLIASAGRPLYNDQQHYSGNIAIDPDNPNVVYISSNAASPFDLTFDLAPGNFYQNIPLASNARYEIWRGVMTDEAMAAGTIGFAWAPITENSSKDNLRPYVPRNSPYGQSVIYFSGTYTAYTNWNTEVRGIFRDKKMTFANWADSHGLSGADAAPDADPNHDGIDNLTAYAFGITPIGTIGETGRELLPHISHLANGTPAFVFNRNTTLGDIEYTVETSTDLKNWTPVSSSIESSQDGIELRSVAIQDGEPRRFYRVKIIR